MRGTRRAVAVQVRYRGLLKQYPALLLYYCFRDSSSRKHSWLDREKSLRCLQGAALLGLPAATYDLGRVYLDGRRRKTYNARKAYRLIAAAAGAGHSEANCVMGDAVLAGSANSSKLARAKRFYLRAARSDDVRGHLSLYRLYTTYGEVSPVRRSAAMRHLKKAAELGDETATKILRRTEKRGDTGRRRSRVRVTKSSPPRALRSRRREQ